MAGDDRRGAEGVTDRCIFKPFGSSGCTGPGTYRGYCLQHSGARCVVCAERATHACHGTIGTFYCAADVCDECDNWSAGIKHDCGAMGGKSISVEDYKTREALRAEAYKVSEERAKARLEIERQERAAARRVVLAKPEAWTLSTVRGLGFNIGIYCPPCEVTVALSDFRGHDNQPLAKLKFRCGRCQELGQVVVKNPRNRKHVWNLMTGECPLEVERGHASPQGSSDTP